MIPVTFPQANHVVDGKGVAADLPVHLAPDGKATSFWKFTKEDFEHAHENGGVWIVLFKPPEDFMFGVTAVSPFLMPRPMTVDPHIADRVFLRFWDSLEVVLLRVEPEEHSFMVEQLLPDTWMVTVRNDDYGPMRFQTNYKFGEELKSLGLASTHYGRFDELLQALNLNPETTLILERTNKTI